MEDVKNTDVETQQEKQHVRSEKVQLDYPTVKVQLPKAAAIKVHETMLILKERKLRFG